MTGDTHIAPLIASTEPPAWEQRAGNTDTLRN